VLVRLACQVIVLRKDPAPLWRKSKAKGAGKEVIKLISELVYSACYLS
jgi:hypothetical protein